MQVESPAESIRWQNDCRLSRRIESRSSWTKPVDKAKILQSNLDRIMVDLNSPSHFLTISKVHVLVRCFETA